MTDKINVDELKNNLKSINDTKLSVGEITSVKLDEASLTSAASGANKAIDDGSTFQYGVCSQKNEELKVTYGDTSSDGFKIKELKPPKLPWDEPNDRPAQGSSILPPYTRGVICGTGVGNANLDLSFNCNFVANLNIDTCLFKLKKTMEMYINKIVRYVWYIVARFMPVLDFIRTIIETLCQLINNLLKIICIIKQLIMCIINTIKSIIEIIQWIISLPVRFVMTLIQCVTSFLNNIMNSIKEMINALKQLGINSLCKFYKCENTATSIS